MERYETIPQQVKAFQALMDMQIALPGREGEWVLVSKGAWVVFFEDGQIRAVADEVFRKEYRKVPPVRPRVMWPDTDTSALPVGGYRPYKNGDITFTTNVSVPDFGRTLPVRYAPMKGGQ